MTGTFEYCGNIAMATGRANPKQTVTTEAWTGKWTRGYLLKNAVLENKTCLRWDDTLLSSNKANHEQREITLHWCLKDFH